MVPKICWIAWLVPSKVAVCAVVTTGDTLLTSGAVSLSRSASARSVVNEVFWVAVVVAACRLALLTVSVVVPSAAIRAWIALAEPLPTATSRITAATPISMPSMVSPERSLFAVTPRSANRIVSKRLTAPATGVVAPPVAGRSAATAVRRTIAPSTSRISRRARRRRARG